MLFCLASKLAAFFDSFLRQDTSKTSPFFSRRPLPKKSGSSMLEVIIATGVIGLVMTATVSVISVSLRTTSLSKAKNAATKYTQEGVEYFRNQRTVLGWETFLEILQTGGSASYCLATLPPTSEGGLAEVPNRNCQSDEFVDENGIFQREATVALSSDEDEDIVTITVVTSWEDSGRPLNSTATLELRNIYSAEHFALIFPTPSPYIPTPIPSPIPTPSPSPIPTPIPTPLPTPGGYWRFNEGTGSTIADSSGNGNTGTWVGSGIKWIAAGIDNMMGRFNGSGDGVTMAASRPTLTFGNNGPFTATGWIRPTILSDYAGFVSKDVFGRTNPYSFMTVTMSNGALFAYNSVTSTWIQICPAASVARGVWSHLAFSFNGTTMTGYVNGSSCGSAAFAYTDVATHAVNIGSWYSPSAPYDFVGAIDEVKLYRAALTAADVLTDYSQKSAEILEPSASWSFNEGTGNTVADSTGTGNTGTWFGSNAHWSSQGVSGAAGRFGYGDGVMMAASSSFNNGNNGPFSIEGWIKPHVLTDFAGFVSKNANRTSPYSFMTASMADGRLLIYDSTVGWRQICPAGSIVSDTWQHVAITYDGATARGYVNGSSCGSVAWTYTDIATHNLIIGSWYSGINNYDFLGLMDEIRFYNYQRSASQVAADAAAFTPPGETWTYRTPITITNTTGAVQTDYPVQFSSDFVSLISAGKMNGDCSDLRFTTSDGVTEIPYWFQEGSIICNTAGKVVWVKVPSIPTSGTTIYAYYGSPSAASGSDGDSVFDFFDDFNNATLNATKWTATGTTSLQNGSLIINTGSVYSKLPVTASTQNRIFEMHAAWATTQTAYAGIQISNANSIAGSNGNSNRLAMFMSAGTIAQTAWGASGIGASYNLVAGSTLFTPTANTYTFTGFGYTPSALNFYGSRSQVGTYANTVQYAPYLILGYFTGSAAGATDGTDLSVNFVIVRKFALPEPTGSWGTEQSGSWTGF